MERNFSLGQGNELVAQGQTYDLHNCYDFGGIAMVYPGHVRLWFTPHEEHAQGNLALILDAHGVDCLELSRDVALGTVRDVDEAGFKAPTDRDLNWLGGEKGATEADHLVLRFTSDNYIRIHAKALFLREAQGTSLSFVDGLAMQRT